VCSFFSSYFSSSPSHATYKTIIEAGQFSVSWLDRSFAKAVTELGKRTGAGSADKLRAVGLHHRLGKSLDVPVIEEASATLECRFASSQRLGDHNLVIGEVEQAEATDDFDDYWTFSEYRPILYAGLERPMGKFREDRPLTRP